MTTHNYLEQLYRREMETVLQILLARPAEGIESGTYEKEPYGKDWSLVD